MSLDDLVARAYQHAQVSRARAARRVEKGDLRTQRRR